MTKKEIAKKFEVTRQVNQMLRFKEYFLSEQQLPIQKRVYAEIIDQDIDNLRRENSDVFVKLS